MVGPCDDGGYYLVGATRAHAALFDSDVMGTRSAFAALVDRVRDLGLRVAVLAEHYDVDLPDDVGRLSRDLSRDPRRAPRTAALMADWRVAECRART